MRVSAGSNQKTRIPTTVYISNRMDPTLLQISNGGFFFQTPSRSVKLMLIACTLSVRVSVRTSASELVNVGEGLAERSEGLRFR